MTITIDASAVAWYGAILGTISAFVSIYNVWNTRPRLKVTVQEWQSLEPFLTFKAREPLVAIEVANVGPIAMHLRTLPWLQPYGETASLMFKGDWMPSEQLDPGTSATMFVRKGEIDLANIRTANVKDKANRIWSVPSSKRAPIKKRFEDRLLRVRSYFKRGPRSNEKGREE